jgi:hypothetical protein
MKVAVETQVGDITDAARARIAMVRPILVATVHALKRDRVERFGGYDKITLADLAREYREGSGDCGICFEYAVHDAISREDARIHPLISNVLEEFCYIKEGAQSILFGAEKNGAIGLIETTSELLTDESRILVGKTGQPPKLKRHLASLLKAFKSAKERERLPPSIRGVWRTDLFVGSQREDRWVATTMKINASDLEGDAGIRVGLYPERRKGESPSRDDSKNLILCPIPYNAGFMELFYSSFFIVKQFLAADAQLPKPVALPSSDDRHVASELVARRLYAVLDVVAALEPMAQPDLLASREIGTEVKDVATSAVAPVAKQT